nr:MAG TPA: ATPase-like protein [Bacteriophage sp.]
MFCNIFHVDKCVAVCYDIDTPNGDTHNTTHTIGEKIMEIILYRNKRNTYSIDKSIIKDAALNGNSAEQYVERIMCSRDGRLFEKVPNEYRYTCNGEVIERGVKDDLTVCLKELDDAIVEWRDEHGAAKSDRNADAHKPNSAAMPTNQAADFTAAGAALAMLAQIKEEQVFNKVCNDLDAFIFEKYGKLPQKEIVVKLPDGSKKSAGAVQHEMFETILKYVTANVPVFMSGPAGTGKSSIAKSAAKALDMDFYFSGAVQDIYKFTGFVDANGHYSKTQFYDFCCNGGVFFLDEMDASIPEVLVALNAAIANRYFDFPCGKVELNENCRFICAGNTYGTGADAEYTGRYQLDAATLDRFAVVDIDYSKDIFNAVTNGNKDLIAFIYDLRKASKAVGVNMILSYRCAQNVTAMESVGLDTASCIKQCIAKGLSKDAAHMIGERLTINNKYADAWNEVF